MLGDAEFVSQKAAVIAELATKRLSADATDFLAGLIPLKEAGALSDDEIQKIKRLAL